MRRRVVITGVGSVNPLGHNVETVWSALREGESGVGEISIFDASSFPTRISAEVTNWDVSSFGADPELWGKRGRHTRFAAGAAHEAVSSSGVLDSNLDPEQFGVYLGSGEGSQDFFSFAHMMAASLENGEFDLHRFVVPQWKSHCAGASSDAAMPKLCWLAVPTA